MSNMDDNSDKYSVVIIGSGIAGLRCAHDLVHVHKIPGVLIVEALDRVGGRILQSSDLIPNTKVELGAEFVHGNNTSLTRLAVANSWQLDEVFTLAQGDGGPMPASTGTGAGYYYLGDQNRLLRYDDPDPDFIKFNEAVSALSDLDDLERISPSASMQDYFVKYGLTDSMLKLADAGYANTAGSNMNEISLRVTCKYEMDWIAIEDYGDYRLSESYAQLIDHYRPGLSIRLSWPVCRIDYSSRDFIIIESDNSSRIKCDRVVVTVPVTTFTDIEYVPSLPVKKVNAVNSLGMKRAAKIILHVTERFWPEDTHGVICSDMFVPEFWVKPVEAVNVQAQNDFSSSSTHYMLSGFATAGFAEKLAVFSEDEIINKFVEQLDIIYGTHRNPNPATACLVKGLYFDWNAVPYIRGGYSFPKVGQAVDAAKVVAEAVDQRIFFAGEATSFEKPGMSVHCAMDTGERASQEVLASIKDTAS